MVTSHLKAFSLGCPPPSMPAFASSCPGYFLSLSGHGAVGTGLRSSPTLLRISVLVFSSFKRPLPPLVSGCPGFRVVIWGAPGLWEPWRVLHSCRPALPLCLFFSSPLFLLRQTLACQRASLALAVSGWHRANLSHPLSSFAAPPRAPPPSLAHALFLSVFLTLPPSLSPLSFSLSLCLSHPLSIGSVPRVCVFLCQVLCVFLSALMKTSVRMSYRVICGCLKFVCCVGRQTPPGQSHPHPPFHSTSETVCVCLCTCVSAN